MLGACFYCFQETLMRLMLSLGLLCCTAVSAQDISYGSAALSVAAYSGGTSLGFIDQPTTVGTALGYGPSQPGLPNGPTLPTSPTQPLAPLAQQPLLPTAAADPLLPQSPADPQQPLAVQVTAQSSLSSGTSVTDASMPPAQKAANSMAGKTFDSLQNVANNVTNLVKVVTVVNSQ